MAVPCVGFTVQQKRYLVLFSIESACYGKCLSCFSNLVFQLLSVWRGTFVATKNMCSFHENDVRLNLRVAGHLIVNSSGTEERR